MSTPVADDLFAGAGGWDLAAADLGIASRGVENMPEARETRDAAGLVTIHDDVWTFRPKYRYDWTLSRSVLVADGLITSPPCQSFSQAGKGAGRQALDAVLALIPRIGAMTLPELQQAGREFGDERTGLVLTPLWFAIHHPYRWLAWEQVPPVLPVWEACAAVLRERGWSVWVGYLHSEQYGDPQTRKRAFLLASLDHVVHPPTPTHSRYYSRTPAKLDPGVQKWVSMAEALGWPGVDLVGFPRRADSADAVTIDGVDYRARDLRPADAPSLTVTEKSRSWQRIPLEGARTLAGGKWEPSTRPADAPSFTVTGSGRNPGFEFVSHSHDETCDCDVTLTATNPRPNAAHRAPCKPAPTMAFGHEEPRWNPRVTPDGLERFAQQSDNVPDYDWPDNRPSTVVAGRELVQAPGATANRSNGSTKSRNDGVRVSVEEAGVLQSFPPCHPWQGSKSKRYLQAGNAVPVRMATAALCAANGWPYAGPSDGDGVLFP